MVEKVFCWTVLELFNQEGNMRASLEPRPSMAERERSKHEVRCSECGRKLLRLKDHVQKEDSFVCASCYQSMVYGHRTVGMEMFE